MNKLLTFLLIAMAIPALAQNNFSGMNYQAVVRDANGDPLPNQTITVRFELYNGVGGGFVSYGEQHAVTTDAHGLIDLVIGEGVPESTFSYADIDWNMDTPWSMEVSIDLAGGTNFVLVGSSQFRAVPYANRALTADTLSTGVHWKMVDNELQNTGEGPVRVQENIFVQGGVFLNNAVNFPGWDISGQTGSLTFNEEFEGPRLTVEPGGNVGIGTDDPATRLDVLGNIRIQDAGNVNGPDPSAAIEVASTTGAILFPRLNMAQRDALIGTPGMVVYNNEVHKFQGFVTTPTDSISAKYDGPLGAYALFLGGRNDGNLVAGGQSFRVTANGALKALTIYNLNYLNFEDPGSSIPRLVHIKVLNGLPNNPGATVLANATLDLYPSSQAPRVITFTQTPVLQAGMDYSFVIEPDASSWDGTWWESGPSGTVPLNDASLYPDGATYISSYPYQGSPSYNVLSGGSGPSDFRFKVELAVGVEGWIDLH